MSGLRCHLAPGLGVGLCLSALSSPFLLYSAMLGLRLCKLRFPQSPDSRLPPVRLRHWKVLEGDWKVGRGEEQGCLPISSSCQHPLKQQRRAIAPASSFFWPSQNQPPRNVPSEAQAPASCTPRGGQSTSQATVPSEVRTSATPPPRSPTSTSQAAFPSEVQAAAAQQPPERARHQPWGVPQQSL